MVIVKVKPLSLFFSCCHMTYFYTHTLIFYFHILTFLFYFFTGGDPHSGDGDLGGRDVGGGDLRDGSGERDLGGEMLVTMTSEMEHRRRKHGGSGGWRPPTFSYTLVNV